MKYSILIVNYNLKNSVARLIEDVKLQFALPCYENQYEILIFDNSSTDGSRSFFENLKSEQLTYIFSEKNIGFGAAMNRLAQIAQGEILILLNPDLEIPNQKMQLPEWIEAGLSTDKVVLAPTLLGTDLKPQANGGGTSGTLTFILQSLRIGHMLRRLGLVSMIARVFSLPLLRNTDYAKYFLNFETPTLTSPSEEIYDWVSGAFWVLRKDHFIQCSGFDENIFLYCEDEDLCRRLKEATRLEIVKSNLFFAIHAVGGTQLNQKRFSKSRLERLNSNIYYLRKWNGSLSAATLRLFYFFYFLAFGKIHYSFQSLCGLKISDSSDIH